MPVADGQAQAVELRSMVIREWDSRERLSPH